MVQGINNKKIIDAAFDNEGTEIPYEDGNQRLGLWRYVFNDKDIYVIISPFPAYNTHTESQWKNVKITFMILSELPKKRLLIIKIYKSKSKLKGKVKKWKNYQWKSSMTLQ